MLHHRWDLSPADAMCLQRRLASRVIRRDEFGDPIRVAGIDVGFPGAGAIARAAVVVLRLPDLRVLETAIADRPTTFPYVPGLLSFREIPAVLVALDKLSRRPDLLLCDGQGYAHPRRIGLASHLGLYLDLPSIGVGKTRLTGTFEPPPNRRGAWTPLMDEDEIIGAVLRSRAGVKPIYVSSGHRVGLESAVRLVMACTRRYKLPETTRAAHALASGHDRAGP
jgi:deoxyribonuclease V